MFTGIIESLAQTVDILPHGTNKNFRFRCPLAKEFKIDQSISHNGVCLTVVDINGDEYSVTAVEETLSKSNLGTLKVSDWVNIERSMIAGARLDGHIVQGHVDTVSQCLNINERSGSWYFEFSLPYTRHTLVVPKGSIAVNGVSLTVVEVWESSFSVAIIPYTYENTNFNRLKKGDTVNLEFDILGKYIAAQFERYARSIN